MPPRVLSSGPKPDGGKKLSLHGRRGGEKQKCSLRSKLSRTKWTKFGPWVLVFHSRDTRKMGREQQGGRKGVGEGKEANAFRKPLDFEKPAHERGSWLVRRGHLDWHVYQVRLNDSSNNSCVTRTCHQRKLLKSFSCCCKIKQNPADLNSLIWQPRLALVSRFCVQITKDRI